MRERRRKRALNTQDTHVCVELGRERGGVHGPLFPYAK